MSCGRLGSRDSFAVSIRDSLGDDDGAVFLGLGDDLCDARATALRRSQEAC